MPRRDYTNWYDKDQNDDLEKIRWLRRRYTANAAKVPKVPGANGICPIKPRVAIYLYRIFI